MWTAMGACFEKIDGMTEAVRCYERAVSCVDREGVALSRLCKIYREHDIDDKRAARYCERLLLTMDERRVQTEGEPSAFVRVNVRAQTSCVPCARACADVVRAVRARARTSCVPRVCACARTGCWRANVVARRVRVVRVAETIETIAFLAQYWFKKRRWQRCKHLCDRLLEFSTKEQDLAKRLIDQMAT